VSETANVEPASESSGLLDNVTVEDQNATPTNPQLAEIDHRADPAQAAAPGAPADRPEWLPENFWKDGQPAYEEMAKSWQDLRKTIAQGKHKAPADGNYDTSVLKVADDPVAQAYVGWAQKHGVSQAAFDDLAQTIGKIAEEAAGPGIDPDAELKQLGPNGGAVVNGMVDWARGLVNKGVWSTDDFEEFKVMGGTARGLRALMKIREAYEGRIPVESVPLEGAPSKDELYQMVADPRYKTDPAYRQKVEKAFAAHVN